MGATTKRKSAAAAEPEAEAAPAKKQAKEEAPKKAGKALPAVKVGGSLPSVELLNEEDTVVDVKDLVAERGAVFFLYPRANTGGCTKQACGFRDNYDAITAAGFDVYGLSFDSPKSQANWKSKYSLPYHLLTDKEGVLIKAFGALKAPKGIKRSHVVVAKGGKVLDMRISISPGDSFAEATKTCAEAAA